MIEIKSGDLFEAKTEAIVNAVNCVGVMGKGLALAFKKRFPENFVAYQQACKDGRCAIGKVFIFDRGDKEQPRFIFNFATKDHWRNPSKIEYVDSGLVSLVSEIGNLGITSIAIPALGCGLGGLNWATVRIRIERAFENIESINVQLFQPGL